MGAWNRIRNIIAWSAYHPSSPPEEIGFTWTGWKKPQKAEFIMPDRTKEIFERKANATLDDIIE